MKLTDNIATHPKILRAGELIGDAAGRGLALAMYVASIGYARHFLTDGYISDQFVRSNPVGSSGESLAKALAHRSVRLFERVGRHGYRIHDWEQHNDSAEKIKQGREKVRERVREFRARQKRKRNGQYRRSA